ncbi:Reverse transcriptase [Phytophthora palmivora]|uniref:Reverse transcriptase n=1 Tax=Phytophthora palmivora TaxID=4796 RepID=A0A2P4XKR2_9STRA|nr:Reverse transcriptase [Phytophthora palmivora]
MKVYELKTKMSPAVRNWYGQLSKHVRTEWSRLSKEFKREYCKSRVSESEKYYTMKQFKDETALAFLYRLNLAAERADVCFRKSERRREQHIKRFINNLTDVTLKTTLQSQRLRKVSDLEYVLKQQEEVNPSGVHSGRGTQPRDFRADNVARNGPRMNRPNRAYVAQDDEAQGSDTQVTFEDDERADLAALSTCVQDVLRDGNPDTRLFTREDLIHEVYRVMNSVGLKLKLNSQKRIKVSGLGGVPTYITASTQIKVTLGRRVVYILDVWVTNIGEGVDVLLRMDIMYSAGVRLCIREGTMALPDEESVLMYGYMVRKHRDRNVPITPLQDVHLRPGEHVNVKIRSGMPLKEILKRHRSIFLGDGNAAPAPARGMVCDLDVGDAKPVAQRPRPVVPQVAIKVYELLKKLLETKLIEHSESPWASPIVIVLKKNGVDIRMCIDYRVVNSFIRLSNYPLPLIDDLLTGLESAMWFMSLDMASGSLNYYHKFIEDFPVVAAVLYELSDEQVRAGRDLSRAKEEFDILKQKIVSTPLLRHPDRTKPFVIIPHANQWAACAVLGQEHDGVIQPVRFTGRVLNDAELRYHIAEKEVLAVIRILHVFKTLIEGCPLVIYTRHLVLKWVIKSKTADGHLVPWGVALSQYDLEIRKIQRDEDGLAAILGAGITPREHLDKIAEALIPAKGRVKAPPVISIEKLEADYSGMVLSFDGAAKTSTRIGSCGCVLWQLPEWKVLDARGYILDGVTVNDAEYFGLIRGLAMARDRGIQDLVVVGDSRIVIQQVQGLINCNQPNLQSRLAECEVLKKRFNSVRLVHVKREFNQAADYLTSKTLTLGNSWVVEEDAEREHLEVVSRIQEQLMKASDEETKSNSEMPRNSPNVLTMRVSGDGALHGPEYEPLPPAARVLAAFTRSRARTREGESASPMGPLEYQAER